MIREKVHTFKNRLFKISDKEPLSKLALCVIIALDILILCVVFQGLNDHTAQLTSPHEYIPTECRNVFIQRTWSEANRIEKLQQLVLADHNNYSYRYNSIFETSQLEQMHPVSRAFYQKIKDIADDSELKTVFKAYQQNVDQLNQYRNSFKQNNQAYNATLIDNENQMTSTKTNMVSEAMKIESLNVAISELEKKINSNSLVKSFWNDISSDDTYETNRVVLIKDLKKFEFWYPLKTFAWQSLFLLPLAFLFYFWNIRSIARDNVLQILISSHLLVIVSIPILFRIIDIVIELIPNHFFKDIFKFLNSFHIIGLWHYALIGISTGIAITSVFIIQKKIFNLRRLEMRRLMKGECFRCGKKTPPNTVHCPFCGIHQFEKCTSCDSTSFVASDFCTTCGVSTKKNIGN